jgi:glycosyltransferase involved in cell wall biosynthesis
MARVTVLIPTFNRQKMVVEAVKSVWAQTYTDYELVVVDDGSTDDTERHLEPWLPKIRYIKKSNGGECSARNVGVRQATSDYVAFLDSDDRWEPRFLDTVMQVVSETPSLGLATTACLVFPKGIQRPRIPKSSIKGELYSFLFQHNFITTSGVVARRDCFEKVGLFDEKLNQAGDYDMWLRIAKEFPIAFLREPLCRWYQHSTNVSCHELEHKLCLQQVLENNYDSTRISSKDWKIRRSRVLVSLGKAYLGKHQRSQAQRCFREAIQVAPWRIRPWRCFLQTTTLKFF